MYERSMFLEGCLDGARLVLLLLALISNRGLVESNAEVSFTLISFSNPQNKLRDGSYCNTDQSVCAMKFSFDFKLPIAYSFVTTDIFASSINYTIGPDAITKHNHDTIPNPFPANTTTTNVIKKLQLKIDVYHFDSQGQVHDVAKFNLFNLVQFGIHEFYFVDGYSNFNLTAEIVCSANYYGDCSVLCIEGASYTCDPSDGSKMCRQGWRGTGCDIEYAVPCNVSAVQNATLSPQQASFNENETVTVSCDPGFLPVSTTLTCFKNGSWDLPWPACVSSVCKKLKVLLDGSTSPSSASTTTSPIGTTASFSCSAGYLLVGSNSTVCQANATWSDGVPTCDEIRCRLISTPRDGSVSPSTASGATSAIGSTANFSCAAGFHLNGSSVMTCLNNGSWDNSEPTCDVTMCPALSTSIYGGYGYYSPTPAHNQAGSTFHQNCVGGYSRVGSPTRYCQTNGTWSGTSIYCLRNCDKITTFTNGTVKYDNPTPCEGSGAEFECDPGLTLVGRSRATCLPNGTWDVTEIPQCLAGCKISDLDIDASNTTISPPSYATDVILPGYTLTFSCQHDYYLNSSRFLGCSGDTAWNNSRPFCLAIGKDTSKIAKQMLKSGMIILAGVLTIFAVLVFVFTYIDKHMQQKLLDQVRNARSNVSTRPSNVTAVRMSQVVTTLQNDCSKLVINEKTDVDYGHMAFSNPVYVEDF